MIGRMFWDGQGGMGRGWFWEPSASVHQAKGRKPSEGTHPLLTVQLQVVKRYWISSGAT
jgi:hypothetical protein